MKTRNNEYSNYGRPMTTEQLETLPSLWSQEASKQVSSKYSFLSTAQVLGALQETGLQPYVVQIARTKDEENRPYTKHLIRLRNSETYLPGISPEVLLWNAHNGSSSFGLELGIWRMVCANGMVVASARFAKMRVRHVSATIEDIVNNASQIGSRFTELADSVNVYRSIEVNQVQAFHMAERAMGLRWDVSEFPYPPQRLLEVNRYADQGKDLWTVFNRVQENLLNGQHKSWRWQIAGRQEPQGSRMVTSINEQLRINRELWGLLEETAQEVRA